MYVCFYKKWPWIYFADKALKAVGSLSIFRLHNNLPPSPPISRLPLSSLKQFHQLNDPPLVTCSVCPRTIKAALLITSDREQESKCRRAQMTIVQGGAFIWSGLKCKFAVQTFDTAGYTDAQSDLVLFVYPQMTMFVCVSLHILCTSRLEM